MKTPFEARIEIFKLLPNTTNWEDIHSLLIPGTYQTVWQSIIECYPEFPKVGRRTDVNGKIVAEWSAIPTIEMLESVEHRMIKHN